MKPRVTCVILAGGRSRRMGTDKRRLPVEGTPLIERVADRLATVSDELLVATRPDDAESPPIGARVVLDRRADAGPLAGMEAAALEAAHPIVVVVAADMPWLSPALLAELARRLNARTDVDAVALATERGPQPLLAAYRREALAGAATEMLNAGERRATRLLERLRSATLPPDDWRHLDPDGRSAVNLNEPADLERSA